MYEYGNIAEAKPGDIVECIAGYSTRYTENKLYILKDIHNGSAEVTKCDDGYTEDRYSLSYFKLVKTLPGSEAKEGDEVIRFKGGTRTCPTGTIFTVQPKRIAGSLSYTADLSAYSSECLVLCKASTTVSESDTPRVAVVTVNVNGHPVGSRIVPTDASNHNWKLADGTNSIAYCHSIGGSCEWEDTLTTYTGIFTPLDETSPATPCSQPTLNSIPEEETMNPIKENITISMTADEYSKHLKSNKTAKPKTQLKTASKWVTIWYGVNGNVDCQTTESPKKATKALQHPAKLGFTFRSYLITESATTDIPVINVEI